MRYNYTQFNTPQFHILSDTQIEELHLATLQILEKTGVAFETQEAIELLGDAGADVSNPNRVKIPSYMVEQALRTAPKTITLYTREGEPAMVLNGMTGSHFGSWHGATRVPDLYTGKTRKCYVEDVAERCRLIDALPNIEFSQVGSVNLTLPVIPDDISDRMPVLEWIYNSSKVIIGSNNNASSLEETIDLCSIVAGGEEQLRKKPFFVSSSEPVSPLIQGKESMEKSLLCAQKGMPNIVYGMQMAGATTPVTFAGCVAIANAEVLSQLVVIQLKNPGAPVIFGSIPSIMDMRTMIYSYGAPEMSLMVGALTELCHYYKLSMWGTGGCSDAKVMGIQAVAESTYSILISALTGADLVHDVDVVGRSLEGIVLANEIIGMVKVLMGGIEINDETLPLDLIERLGPGANYLAEPHTLKHFREVWAPTIFARGGVKDCEKLIKEKTIKLLETHQPKPLPEDVVKELKKVEESWLKRIGLKEYPKREQVT